MTRTHFKELFTRHDANPILTASDWTYPANTVFNPGAVKLPSGETLLLARVEDRRGISHLTAARSDNGVDNWRIDPKPTIASDPENHPEKIWGIEDPRITWVEELKRYAVTYTSYSTAGPLVSLALTSDFREFERIGVVMSPEDKDAALFPRRIDGRWALLHRPVGAHYPGNKANIWLSFSPDLSHWGDHCSVLEARRGAWWDANKIGLSPPPIETPEGWLIVYHGVRATPAGCLYRLGLALLDLDQPCRAIFRGDEWVFGPSAPYEQVGDIGGVVFPCGAIHDKAAGTLRIYYGAADTSIALATANMSELLDWLMSAKQHRQV
ncbi:MAG: glycosidase [Blastocatellia bacterium]